MFDAKKRANAIRRSLVGGGRSSTQKRVDAVERALGRARRAGLEEAAEICDGHTRESDDGGWYARGARDCAEAIRVLLGQLPPEGE